MKPILSYTIWFSQRTGSTLLCKALEAARVAGNHTELQRRLWEIGSTPNGAFGLKHSFHEPDFSQLFELFHMFPNHRHIFMTRGNKIRLAASCWKAIQS